MMMNGIHIAQQGQDYLLFTPQGIKIAYISCPPDGQLISDAVALKAISKYMGQRWGVASNKNDLN